MEERLPPKEEILVRSQTGIPKNNSNLEIAEKR